MEMGRHEAICQCRKEWRTILAVFGQKKTEIFTLTEKRLVVDSAVVDVIAGVGVKVHYAAMNV
jgi:hypothetical protein